MSDEYIGTYKVPAGLGLTLLGMTIVGLTAGKTYLDLTNTHFMVTQIVGWIGFGAIFGSGFGLIRYTSWLENSLRDSEKGRRLAHSWYQSVADGTTGTWRPPE